MRPLEWVVLLAFGPVLLWPIVGECRRHRWVRVTTPLPALASVVQVIGEGWRTQMGPLYVLAVIVLAGGSLALPRRGGSASRLRRGMAAAALALLLIPSAVLAGWLLPVITLPEPTGPYRVGIVDREVVDEARGRTLMVSVWYPAGEGGKDAPLTHHPDHLMTALANLSGLPAPLFQHLRYITLAAREGAPVLAEGETFPVLVFSHGLVGMRLQSSSTLQDLASWGYVAVAVDHTDAAAVTVFPNGEARFYDAERFGIPAGAEPATAVVEDRMFPVWVADQRRVYDAIEAWARDDPMFGGRLDAARIASFGHSFGGATAVEVCLVDQRCRSAVDMDGGLYGASKTASPVRPVMVMSAADSLLDPDARASWGAMIARADVGYWLELPNSNHLSFTFSQLLSPLLAPPGFEPRDGLRVVDAHLRAFFDAHVRGADPPPQWPTSDSSDVRWLTD